MFPFRAWLDPYIAPRRTKTNVIRVDVNESEDDLAEDGERKDGDENDSSISEKSDSCLPEKIESRTTGRPKYVKKAR